MLPLAAGVTLISSLKAEKQELTHLKGKPGGGGGVMTASSPVPPPPHIHLDAPSPQELNLLAPFLQYLLPLCQGAELPRSAFPRQCQKLWGAVLGTSAKRDCDGGKSWHQQGKYCFESTVDIATSQLWLGSSCVNKMGGELGQENTFFSISLRAFI